MSLFINSAEKFVACLLGLMTTRRQTTLTLRLMSLTSHFGGFTKANLQMQLKYANIRCEYKDPPFTLWSSLKPPTNLVQFRTRVLLTCLTNILHFESKLYKHILNIKKKNKKNNLGLVLLLNNRYLNAQHGTC